MISPAYIITTAAVAVLAMLWSESRIPWLEWLFKPLAALCFVVLALEGGALGSAYGQVMLGGLVLCLCGDVLLIPQNDKSFVAGLTAFLLGHLFYALAFFQLPGNYSDNFAGIAFSLLPVVALAVISLRWLRPHLPQPMKVPVVAYILVICSMLLAAGMTWSTTMGFWVLTGAWGFALSDLSVARNQFIQRSMINRIWGIPLYFASQLMLAWSVRLV